jgi:hypothetical protein
MKTSRSVVLLAAIVAVMLSVAWAAPKNKQTIQLPDATTVGSVTLAPGEYTVQWNGTGPDVEVSFHRGTEIVATAPATLEAARNPQVSVTVDTKQAGVNSLVEIETRTLTLHFAPLNVNSGQ